MLDGKRLKTFIPAGTLPTTQHVTQAPAPWNKLATLAVCRIIDGLSKTESDLQHDLKAANFRRHIHHEITEDHAADEMAVKQPI